MKQTPLKNIDLDRILIGFYKIKSNQKTLKLNLSISFAVDLKRFFGIQL